MNKLIPLLLLGSLAGCTTTPSHQYEGVEYVQVHLADIAEIPAVRQVAAHELADAYERLAVAELMIELGRDPDEVEHQAYMAKQYANLALELMELDSARTELAARRSEVTIHDSAVPRLAGMSVMLEPRPISAASAPQVQRRTVRVALTLDRVLQNRSAAMAAR